MRKMDNCKNDVHQFETINIDNSIYGDTKIIKWCSYCGTVVIDPDAAKGYEEKHNVRTKTPESIKFIPED